MEFGRHDHSEVISEAGKTLQIEYKMSLNSRTKVK